MKDATDGTAQKVQDALLSLRGKVPQIRDIEVGVDVVRSERSYDLALVARFDSREDMEAYQVHPEHQKVVEYIRSVTTDSVAVDYVSNLGPDVD
jgi:predicted RNase H-like nuclease (RuvC/YqgF family)